MQWTNITVRKRLSEIVFTELSKGFLDFKEMLQRYSSTWKDSVNFVEKASSHFHGLGCHFLQSSIGLTLPFNYGDNAWRFSSWIEYKVKPLKEKRLPCPCIWEERCSRSKTLQEKLEKCFFYSKGNRRFDLCWIEKSLLDNIAITAEVETRDGIKSDLAKLFSVFKNSTRRDNRGFDNPIVHVQLDLSGRNSEKTIIDFMERHFSNYILSPSIIYINQQSNFSKWFITYFYRGKVIKKRSL